MEAAVLGGGAPHRHRPHLTAGSHSTDLNSGHERECPSSSPAGADQHDPRRHTRRAPLLQESRGRVVGQHLAAGLTRRAVVDGVAGVLDRPDRVAADGAGIAGPAVHRARAGPWTNSCRRGLVRRRAPRRCTTSIASATVGRAGRAELAGVRERRDPRTVADLVRQPPTDAGDHPLVAQEPVHAHRVRSEQRGQFVGGDRRPPPARACRAAAT